MKCKFCCLRFDPTSCQMVGDKAACDPCRAILANIRERAHVYQPLTPEFIQARIPLYAVRAAAGLPLFEGMR